MFKAYLQGKRGKRVFLGEGFACEPDFMFQRKRYAPLTTGESSSRDAVSHKAEMSPGGSQ